MKTDQKCEHCGQPMYSNPQVRGVVECRNGSCSHFALAVERKNSETEKNLVPLEEIPVGSQFRAPEKGVQPSPEEIRKANDWWGGLSDHAKVMIYWSYMEQLQGD